MRKLVAIVPLAALAFAACDSSTLAPPEGVLFSTQDVHWQGKGTHLVDGARVLDSEECDEESTPYLHWVLTINGATTASITGPWGTADMEQKGSGAFHYTSGYYDLDDLLVYATYEVNGARLRGAVNLVISNGCPGSMDIGAWCSPGYWGNRTEAIWQNLTGFDFATMFNGNVSPAFYVNHLDPDQTIKHVIDTTPPVAGAAGPYGLDARNAAAAFLTSALDGFVFDPDLMTHGGQVCPFNAHGEPDPDFYANE